MALICREVVEQIRRPYGNPSKSGLSDEKRSAERGNAAHADDPRRLEAIKEAIHLDHGPFGLELDATSIRTFVDSSTGPPDGPPTLLTLHLTGELDLYELTSLHIGNVLDRPRVEAFLVDNQFPVDDGDIDEYIASGGAGPHFKVLAFRRSAETEWDFLIDTIPFCLIEGCDERPEPIT